MNASVLPHVERREVETEGADATRQSPHPEKARLLAAVMTKAGRDQVQVAEEVVRSGITGFFVRAGRLQPRIDELEQDAVGHVEVPRAHLGGARRKARAIVLDALSD